MDGRVKLTWYGASITREGMTAIAAFEDALERGGHHGYLSSNWNALETALRTLPYQDHVPYGTTYEIDALCPSQYKTKVAFDHTTQLTIEMGDDGEYWMTDIRSGAPKAVATEYIETRNAYKMEMKRIENSASVSPIAFNRRNLWSIMDIVEEFQNGIEDNKNIEIDGFFETWVVNNWNLYEMYAEVNTKQFVGASIDLCITSAHDFALAVERGASYKTATHIDLTIGEDGKFWMTGLHAAPVTESSVKVYEDGQLWYEYRWR